MQTFEKPQYFQQRPSYSKTNDYDYDKIYRNPEKLPKLSRNHSQQGSIFDRKNKERRAVVIDPDTEKFSKM